MWLLASLSDRPPSFAPTFDNWLLLGDGPRMVRPGYNLTKKRLKKIPDDLENAISREAKALLHAHRDCLRNQGKDTVRTTFHVQDGYYGEAFGMMRTLQVQGYGYFGSDNIDALAESSGIIGARADGKYLTNVNQDIQNLKWWFSKLCDEVLVEEGWRDKTYRCEYCLEKYRKDTASLIEKEASRGLVEA